MTNEPQPTGNCIWCSALFAARDLGPVNGGIGDWRLYLCDTCLIAWQAERDQFYAECKELKRAKCADEGHPMYRGLPGEEHAFCLRCGDVSGVDPFGAPVTMKVSAYTEWANGQRADVV
jgi:hypothetical protein